MAAGQQVQVGGRCSGCGSRSEEVAEGLAIYPGVRRSDGPAGGSGARAGAGGRRDTGGWDEKMYGCRGQAVGLVWSARAGAGW